MKLSFGVRTNLRVKDEVTRNAVKESLKSVEHWYHRVEVLPGMITPGVNDCQETLEKLNLPADCSGLRVLDIGARDGFFSFIAEQRGAREVVAIDYVPAKSTGFAVLKEIFSSEVKFYQDNVYNLSAERYGQFDIVLFLGVIYHLRNPLLALDAIREVCADRLYVESHVIDSDLPQNCLATPVVRFYGRDQLDNDPTNWWGPSAIALREMVESSNFTVLSQDTDGRRCLLRCRVNQEPTVKYFRKIEKGLVQS